MRRRPLIGALLVLVALVAWAVGAWFGAHRPEAPAPPDRLAVPLAPGTPERVQHLPAADPTGEAGGISGMDTVLTADGRALADVDMNGSLAIRDLASGQERTYAVGTPAPVNGNVDDHAQYRHGLALSADARTAWVTDGWGRALHVVDVASGAVRASIPIPAVPTTVALVGPLVVVGDATGAITTLDAASGRPIGFHDVAADAIADLAATPDGHHVVVASATTSSYPSSTVFAVDLTNPAAPTVPFEWPVLHPRSLHGDTVVVSPDGTRAYVVSAPPPGARSFDGDTEGGVMALDLRSGQALGTIPGSGAQSVALSPDGRHLHIGRSRELEHASVITPASIVDTHDTGPDFPLIGSLTDTSSSESSSTLLAAPDGRRLYASGNDLTVVMLRGP